MGYIVRRLKSERAWKVQFRSYKGGRNERDLSPSDFMRLGLHSGMDFEEVKNRCRQLNTQEELKRQQEKRNTITSRLNQEDLIINAYLPEALRLEFEASFIINSDKKVSHWRTAKKLMLEVKIEPCDWEFYRTKWFKLFESKAYSLDYVQKLTLILNRWGKFVAYRNKSFFEPLSSPKGVDQGRIVEAYEESKKNKASDPLTPDQLEGVITSLSSYTYNWLYLSVWLGLRPSEVDTLLLSQSPKTWYLEDEVIWVYQRKLKLSGIPSKERLKPIPIKYPEQTKCLEIIKEGKFERPIVKTLARKFPKHHITTYGGRKGFTDLMLDKGNTLEAISQWLGHRSLNRTWRVYKDKKKVLYK